VVIREVIKYTDYRKFGSKSRITYEGKEIGNAKDEPQDKPR
jgi:hypothetical protein